VGQWRLDWAWGLPLIVLNTVVHVIGLGLLYWKGVRILERLVAGRHFMIVFAVGMSLAVLFAAVLHFLEAVVWATAYVLLGAMPDTKSAMLYSLNAVTTYGHTQLALAPHWRLMGALEALNGVLLSGLTVAALFAMIQRVLLLSSPDQQPNASARPGWNRPLGSGPT